MSNIWSIIATVLKIVWRWICKKDANEIPNAVDKAQTDSAKGDDNSLNADLDAARKRMRH